MPTLAPVGFEAIVRFTIWGSMRTLVVAVRGEPPSLATKAVVAYSPSLRAPLPPFNAKLDGLDEREIPYPYLAEALPQLGE